MFGRLTLNPVVHFDPIGGLFLVITALLPGGLLFGWAKPTPVNPSILRDRRNGEVLVALAGPASNLIMASLGAVAFRVIDATGVSVPPLVFELLLSFVIYNVGLAVFNMIPVPPLDGSNLLFASCRRSRPGGGVPSFSSTGSSSCSRHLVSGPACSVA